MVASQHKSSNAGDSDVPKRGRTVLPMSEKVCTYRKKTKVYMAFDNIRGSGISWGSWDVPSPDKQQLCFPTSSKVTHQSRLAGSGGDHGWFPSSPLS